MGNGQRKAKGKWVKGKESALWTSAVPGLRPGTLLQACVLCFGSRACSFVLV
jgi:hypothetical protein